jgi:cytochrome c-type biogenesis protein CcmH
MTTFVVLAAALALLASVAIAIPLVRTDAAVKQAPWTALIVTAVLLVGAAGLYGAFSNWSWTQPPPAADAPQNMVSTLARRLQSNPNDFDGWMMLGRSYSVLQQQPLAIRAYERANQLANGKNPEALVALAEALAVQDENALSGRAGRLIEQALELAPNSPKALFYGAVSALQRGALPLARERFVRLLVLNPPDNVKPLLQRQIDTIDQRLAGGASAPNAPPASSQSAVTPATSGVAPAVRIKVALAPNVKMDGALDAPLFVFVRDPKQPGPPLAVKRLTTRFPQTVELTAADAMVAGRAFTAGQDVEVVARIARSGSPIAHSGDPFGQVGYHIGRDGVVEVLIDRLTP